MARLTHVDRSGRARMVDVGSKPETSRRAVARASVLLSEHAFRLVEKNALDKGDVMAVAQIAGIQAGKRASEWIPLCHPIPLDSVAVSLDLDPRRRAVLIESVVSTRAATGVEMEAMVAASAAALTVYDMCKAVDRAITIEEIALVSKIGGKSGTFVRSAGRAARPAGSAARPARSSARSRSHGRS